MYFQLLAFLKQKGLFLSDYFLKNLIASDLRSNFEFLNDADEMSWK
jgi:hypothetical protein